MNKKRLINGKENSLIQKYLRFLLSENRRIAYTPVSLTALAFQRKIIEERCFSMPNWTNRRALTVGSITDKDVLIGRLVEKGCKVISSEFDIEDVLMNSIKEISFDELTDKETVIEVVRLDPEEIFGVSANSFHNDRVYRKWAWDLGLEPCPPDTAPQLILQNKISFFG